MRRKLCKTEFVFVRNRRFMLVASLIMNINIGGFLDVAIARGSAHSPDEKATSVEPSCPSSEQAEIYIKQGIESAKKQDYDQAIQVYTKASELCDKNAATYYHRANAYTNKRYYVDALKDYTKAVQLDPEFADAFNNRCYVYNALGNYDLALGDCSHAIHLDPRQTNFYIGRANAYFKLGDDDSAIDNYTQASILDPHNGNAFLGLARVYIKKSDYDRALKDLNEAIALIPMDANNAFPNALNNRCWVYAHKNQPEKGLDDCKKAVELRPKDPHSLDSLALTYFLMSRLEKDKSKKDKELSDTIKNYNEALLYSPNLASSLYGRGRAKRELGDSQGGNADISAAKNIAPNIEDEFEKGLPIPSEDSAN